MKNTRRLKRMTRAKRNRAGSLNLTSLMDVFTILVLYLLVNQSTIQIEEPPKDVKLPESVAEAKPRETVVLMVSEELVTVKGQAVAETSSVIEGKPEAGKAISDALRAIKESTVGTTAEAEEKSNEITIMAHRTVPFKVLKNLMNVCTATGFTKISLAVNQKSSQAGKKPEPQE